MPKKTVRFTFNIPIPLHQKMQTMPWGTRAAVICALLDAVTDAAAKHGKMIYGAVLGGDFEIIHSRKKETWNSVFQKWIDRGCDHEDAAAKADERKEDNEQ